MPLSNRLKAMIAKNCTAKELQEEAQKEGMSTLKQSARRLVLEGVTSLEEMRRVAYNNDEDS
jgi:type IV pilus assembly protein PilB